VIPAKYSNVETTPLAVEVNDRTVLSVLVLEDD
jgi:hypothetical protein